MGKKIKDYIHFYIGNDVRIFNEVTKEWSKWRKITFTDAALIYNYDKVAQLKLKRLTNMDYELYNTFRNNNENICLTGEIIMEVAKRGYDLFGLIEAGLAIDMQTIQETN